MIFSKNRVKILSLPIHSSPQHKLVRIINLSKNTILAEKAKIADNFFSRLKGLLGKLCLATGEGLILVSCDSVHTLFMRFPIDVAFVNKENMIIKTYSCLKPWRLSAIFLNSALCLELPAGVLSVTRTQEGDHIKIEPLSCL